MESLIGSPQWYNLALTLIHFLWQGCVIALVLKLLLSVTPYNKSQLRYTWASMAMLASLITPVATFISNYQPDAEPISYFAQDIAAIINTQNLANNEVITWYQDIFDSLPYVSMLWLSIVCLLAAKLLIEIYNVNRLPYHATTEASEELNLRVQQLAEQIGLTKTPRLLISLKTDIPMALGWIKPVVLIPVAMVSGLTPAQLDMLILHELAHIRRHDYLVNFIQTLVEILLFFHPCVRWISKQMRNEREYCSDDIAVGISGTPVAYAKTLADTATLCKQHRHHAIPAMAMAASGGDLKQRVVRLVDQHNCSSTDDSGKFLATIFILFSVLAVLAKPYMDKDFIDLSSGRISFLQSASEFIQQQPTHEDDLSATSIAQLLLKNEQSIVDETPEQQTELPKVITISEQQTPTNIADTANHTAQADTETQPQQPVFNENTNHQQAVAGSNTAALSKANTQTELLVNSQAKPAIPERVFKNTDSRQQFRMSNPYAQQVAELADEPVYQQKEPQFSRTKSATQDTPQTSIKQPIFVSAPVKKQASIQPKIAIRKAAEILVSPDPKYPSTAKRRGLELDVQVNFVIDTQGRVTDIEFEQKSKVSFFRSAIRTAMAKWRFLPAKVNGQPVESKMSKIFSFSLMK